MPTRTLNRFGLVVALLAASLCLAAGNLAAENSAAPTLFQVQLTGHGQPMILIPGLSSSGETWTGTVQHFQGRYRCYVLTLAGFAGVPPVRTDRFLDSVVEQLDQYIRDNKLSAPVIVGHSLGGTLALRLAARYPHDVGSLVIVDSLPFLPHAWMNVDSAAAAMPMAEGMRKRIDGETREQYDAFVRSGASTRGMVSSDADFNKITQWGLTSDQHTVAQAMYELYTTDLRSQLQQITAPTLVIETWVGLKDVGATRDGVNQEFHDQYANLKNVRYSVSDNGHHFVMFDDPAWFYQQLDDFLSASASTHPAAAQASH
jgi:pimeloyl-ACP methyl ester carboxylesterase